MKLQVAIKCQLTQDLNNFPSVSQAHKLKVRRCLVIAIILDGMPELSQPLVACSDRQCVGVTRYAEDTIVVLHQGRRRHPRQGKLGRKVDCRAIPRPTGAMSGYEMPREDNFREDRSELS